MDFFEKGKDLLGLAKAFQRVKGGQGAEDLWLVVVIPVIALRSVQRNPETVFFCIAFAGMSQVRVGLDGQRSGRRKDLEQERQVIGKPLGRLVPEDVFRIVLDELGKRDPNTVPKNLGNPVGMGAHPQFRRGAHRGRSLPQELGNESL
jgi:hypothetical protein